MTDEQTAARGHRAEREWTELEAAFSAVRSVILEQIVATPIAHPETVLRLQAAAQNLDAVKKAIRNVVDHGLVAQRSLDGTGLLNRSH